MQETTTSKLHMKNANFVKACHRLYTHIVTVLNDEHGICLEGEIQVGNGKPYFLINEEYHMLRTLHGVSHSRGAYMEVYTTTYPPLKHNIRIYLDAELENLWLNWSDAYAALFKN